MFDGHTVISISPHKSSMIDTLLPSCYVAVDFLLVKVRRLCMKLWSSFRNQCRVALETFAL